MYVLRDEERLFHFQKITRKLLRSKTLLNPLKNPTEKNVVLFIWDGK